MGPDPCPKAALNRADSAWPQPTSLHTTSASIKLQLSWHTVPHLPLWRTSTLPEQKLEPFTSLIGVEPGAGAPANSPREQMVRDFAGHAITGNT